MLPFEWHSFCISINVEKRRAVVFHNGHVQAIQRFKDLNDQIEDEARFMTIGHLGGAKFVGKLMEFEVFGRSLPDQDLLEWTLCQNKGNLHFRLLLHVKKNCKTYDRSARLLFFNKNLSSNKATYSKFQSVSLTILVKFDQFLEHFRILLFTFNCFESF